MRRQIGKRADPRAYNQPASVGVEVIFISYIK
jgi:hypothetical protein